ncbi:hypothetical protein niasHT_033394 [Heterodera trifolii]|uniref:Uncharacterized protein n=1 Tax=Heterodera trifolii TaxID=157864 RepID=A0ABD2HQV5_9BILA
MTPGMPPMVPGFNPMTPGMPPMMPGFNPMTPGMPPMVPEFNPMMPGFNPMTPGMPPMMPVRIRAGARPGCAIRDSRHFFQRSAMRDRGKLKPRSATAGL